MLLLKFNVNIFILLRELHNHRLESKDKPWLKIKASSWHYRTKWQVKIPISVFHAIQLKKVNPIASTNMMQVLVENYLYMQKSICIVIHIEIRLFVILQKLLNSPVLVLKIRPINQTFCLLYSFNNGCFLTFNHGMLYNKAMTITVMSDCFLFE